MIPSIDIITPCSRPHLLPLIEPSIAAGRDFFKITWWVVYDSHCVGKERRNFTNGYVKTYHLEKHATEDPVSIIGNAQNNYALERIPGDHWCYFLSDDNAMHPSFWSTVSKAIAQYPGRSAICFHQQVGSMGVRVAKPENVRIEGIDLAQYLLKRSLIGGTRFQLDLYQSDGKIVEDVFHRSPEKFLFIDAVLSYYNRLR